MRTTWVVPVLLALAVLFAGAADAYVAQGHPWPGGVIRYYNAAPDQAWAVKRAVAAWNSSGAKVRLVAVAASQADVRIEHFPRVSCTINAEATVGYSYNARVWIFRRDDGSPYCNRYVAALALAHEFGHVLGLGHETRGCALMNPSGTIRGPDECPWAQPWQWRCRLLMPDDVAGAVALYGGRAAPQRGSTDCDLYRGIATPKALTVEPTSVSHQFRISFRRPSAASVPAFLSAGRSVPESFVAGASAGGCPADAHAFPRRLWDTAAGRTEQTYLVLPSGVSCVSVWAVDAFGRPSARPATSRLRVVEAG
jgi:hypothetical protein